MGYVAVEGCFVWKIHSGDSVCSRCRVRSIVMMLRRGMYDARLTVGVERICDDII